MIWRKSQGTSKKRDDESKQYFPPLKFQAIEPENIEKFDIASSFVTASVMKRRTEQSINVYSLAFLAFGLLVGGGWLYLLQASSQKQADLQSARATRFYEQVHGTPSAQANNNDMFLIGGTSTPTTTPAPVFTPTPTLSPTPTAIYSVNMVFKYSYYNPKLGGANCYTWDAVLNDCVSMMANGEDWHPYYGKVVACAPEIALGSVIQITYPDALKGYWTCKDRGGLITGLWIDFLDLTKRYEWGDPVSGILYPPTVPMEQITQGSH